MTREQSAALERTMCRAKPVEWKGTSLKMKMFLQRRYGGEFWQSTAFYGEGVNSSADFDCHYVVILDYCSSNLLLNYDLNPPIKDNRGSYRGCG